MQTLIIVLFAVGLVLLAVAACLYFSVPREKPSPSVKPKSKTGFVQARSWHGVTCHIRDLSQNDHLALCGYDSLDDVGEDLTEHSWLDLAANQHENHRQCQECGDRFLLLVRNRTDGITA